MERDGRLCDASRPCWTCRRSEDDKQKLADYDGKPRALVLAENPWLHESMLSKWMKPSEVEKLGKRMEGASIVGGRRRNNVAKRKGSGGRKPAWVKDEQELVDDIKKKRDDGLKVRAKFVRAHFKQILKKNHPAGTPMHDKAFRFKTSSGWLRRLMDRNELTWRKKNNKRTFVADKYIPAIRAYLNNLRRLRAQVNDDREATARLERAAERAGEAGREEERREQLRWGLLDPWVTFNVDQVPLPFAVDDGITMDFVGAKRVWVKQIGSGLDKRQATLQLCIRARGEQPKPCLIFRGGQKRNKTQRDELKKYDEDVVVPWQKNAWADTEVCLNWAKLIGKFKPSDFPCDNPTKLMIVDSLNAQISGSFEAELKRAKFLLREGVKNATDIWQPVDAGIGQHYKRLIGQFYDEWLESDHALQYLKKGAIPTPVRRILLTQWSLDSSKYMLTIVDFGQGWQSVEAIRG